MEIKDYISLDVGKKRTGMARASTRAKIAEPLKTVPTQKVLEELAAIKKNKLVEAIVVGLPRNLNGDDTAQTVWVREWVVQAKPKINLPMYWQDEALTSVTAESMKLNYESASSDSLAAAIVLQNFLDSTEADRTAC